MVVRLDAGREAVRAYVEGEAAKGLRHVLSLVRADNERVLGLIDDLSEEQAHATTPADEWSVAQVMHHLASTLDRSRARLEALSAGKPFVNPAVAPGSAAGRDYASFDDLRRAYREGMAGIIGVLERADERRGLELTAEHAQFGPFNWLQWAVYSHHVHTHDHVGQLEKITRAPRA
ncbi:MAG TPA: DinB family protein [Dehalococcoidia bacterium]|nr:DinB family protein [Dehalococcoidia bacterium]